MHYFNLTPINKNAKILITIGGSMGRHKKFVNLGAVRLIKKYSNRKLYDTNVGKYLLLEDIAKLVQAGENVVVMEHKEPSKDITGETLVLAYGELLKSEKSLNSPQAVVAVKNMIKNYKTLSTIPIESPVTEQEATITEINPPSDSDKVA